MTVRTVLSAGEAWNFAPDDPQPAIALRSQALIMARLIDEVTQTPPEQALTLATGLAGALPRASGGGRVGVVGRPGQLFYAPTVALAEVDLSVTATGFLPLALRRALGSQPGYPDAFAAPDLGDVALHRTPVAIAGRVASRAAGPLVGATVTITGVWAVQQHPPGPPQPPNAMPLFAGLYRDRPAGAQMRRRNLAPAAQVKTLARPALAGDTVVRLSDRQAIAAPQILALDYGDPGRVEYVGITSIDTGSSADQPADFTLDLPLRRDHAERCLAARAVPGPGGANNAVTRAARAGDATLWTAGLAGIGPGTNAIEISGGGPVEYQATTIYTVQSAAGGAFRLPPIHRIAALAIRASHASQPSPLTRIVTPAWAASEQIEDFVFP